MMKPIYLLPLLIIGVLSSPANAQYTQMIVDDQNRVMPIFFTDPETMVQPITQPTIQPSMIPTQQRFPNTAPVVMNNPRPPVVRIPKPRAAPTVATQTARRNTNPLRGPYLISQARHRVMESAHAAIGIPYKYGGNNPARGLDCSSLMQFILKRAVGVKIPRTAAAQRDKSKTIAFQELQPGDLLFFKIDARTNHVGIYIGHGKFIHASSSNRRAVIASMELPYWKKRFVKFGSYLNS